MFINPWEYKGGLKLNHSKQRIFCSPQQLLSLLNSQLTTDLLEGGGGRLEQHPPYQDTTAKIPPATFSKFIASLYRFCLLLKSRPAVSVVLFQHFTHGECQLSVPDRSFLCTLPLAHISAGKMFRKKDKEKSVVTANNWLWHQTTLWGGRGALPAFPWMYGNYRMKKKKMMLLLD